MVLGCILPVALHNGQMHFLFGKECEMEDSAPGWSDFGGGCENCADSDTVKQRTKKIFDTAVREGVEESTGFLGTEQTIKDTLIFSASVANTLRQQVPNAKYSECESISTNGLTGLTTYFLPCQYDPNLPVYYNRNHALLWSSMDKKRMNMTKLFEKSEIGWFTEADIIRRRGEFRWFYRDILDLILLRIKSPLFKKFVQLSTMTNRKIQGQRVYKIQSATNKPHGVSLRKKRITVYKRQTSSKAFRTRRHKR